MKRLLVISPNSLDAAREKGTDKQLLDYNYGGYFDTVVFWYFNLRFDRHEKLSSSVEVIETSRKFRNKIIDSFYYLYKGQQIINYYKFDIIRATDPYYRGLIGLILARVSGIPFCVSIHADYDKCHQLDPKQGGPKIFGSRMLAKQLERFVLARSKVVMPIRESLAHKALACGAEPAAIRLIPHGIDMAPFKQPPKINIYEYFKIDKNLKIISVVGRLSKENYVDDILEMGKKLFGIREDFVIIIAGGGPEEGRIRQLVAGDAGLRKAVFLAGFQPNEICLDLRKASSVSLCLMGGFSLIEACAAGRPVIAYDVEWHRELVRNKETGFLVAEHDINGLSETISFLLDNPADANRIGNNAQILTFEKHDIRKTSIIKYQWYEELLEKSPQKV